LNDLPSNAQKYLKIIEQLVGVETCMVSLGDERSQTMMLKNPFHRT
ncbi:MAG: adenylosuccinate synthetase, partial [Deltaproteobacteria bacterium]|nr:adenylosuccinate synthetase [Deltaproteobacteria bacterium]